MPGFLKQSTASQSRALGPFVDDTDFKTLKTALTINNTDIKLVVNGGASANKNSGGGTHRVNGVYGVTFDATDTATVGEMEVSVSVAGALVVFDKFFVVEEAIYDALFAASATGLLPANLTQIDGNATNGNNATLNLKKLNIINADASGVALYVEASGTGSPIAFKVLSATSGGVGFQATGGLGQATGTGALFQGGTIGVSITGENGDGMAILGGTVGGATKHGMRITTSSSGGSGIAATGNGAGDGITATKGTTGVDIRGAITGDITGNLSGSVGSLTTNNDKTGYGLSATAIQAIWDALTSALTTAGSIGKRIVDFLTGDAYVRLGAPAGASMSADIAAIRARESVTVTVTATVQTDAGNSATQILTDLTETEVDHWAFALVKITSGTLAEQVRKCTGYDGAGTLTFTDGFTATPADGVTIELVND